MYAIHFYENKTYVFNRASREIPSVNENVIIKGRKGTVITVLKVKENVYHVFIEFEKVKKSKTAATDWRKKRKR